MNLQEVFGKNVKEERLRQGLSQSDLAKYSGLERTHITNIEKGKINITIDTIEKISLALNVDLNNLFKKEVILHPFVKWAGGKTQLLNKLREHFPQSFNKYYEPFIGSGSLFFNVRPKDAVINDNCEELMKVYKCFKDPNEFRLLKEELRKMQESHNEDYYLKIRAMDKDSYFKELPIYKRAARMIYLNKSCFNGLYRVNRNGYFNVPSGKKSTIKCFDEENLNNIYHYFESNKIKILCTDFEKAVEGANEGDFIYFDPPYDSFENTKTFTSYSKDMFNKDEQVRLANLFRKLSDAGCYVMLSNHNTNFIRNLYQDFNIHVVNAKRMINSDANGRGDVEEVIITNY